MARPASTLSADVLYEWSLNGRAKDSASLNVAHPGDLEEGAEEVVEDLLEASDEAVALVDVVEARHLDDPAHVVRVHAVLHRPTRQLVPLVRAAAVDREAQLSVLRGER